jgi:hypothetical protein
MMIPTAGASAAGDGEVMAAILVLHGSLEGAVHGAAIVPPAAVLELKSVQCFGI